MHLNIAAGTSVRFEPGQERVVELVEYAGDKRAVGFNMLIMGSTTGKWDVKQAIDKAAALDFSSVAESEMESEAKAAAEAANKVARGTTGASSVGSTSARQAGSVYHGHQEAASDGNSGSDQATGKQKKGSN